MSLATTVCKDDKGASAIEFALVLPLLLMVLLFIVEYCLMDFASVQLDSALAETARAQQTGQQAFTTPTSSSLKDLLLANLVPSFLFTPDQLSVTVESFGNYAAIGSLEPCAAGFSEPCSGSGQYVDVNGDGIRDLIGGDGNGGSGREVGVYVVNYTWQGITPVWNLVQFFVAGSNGTSVSLSSSILLQNEPFPSSR